MPSAGRMRVSIVVLGDLGNSPRMQYHALALATTVAAVDLIGYAGSPLRDAVAAHPSIRVHLLPPPRTLEPDVPMAVFFAAGVWRVLTQSLRLLWLLSVVTRPDAVLVQNPPAMPTLLVAFVAARLRAARLIIDWHNFGCSMLALRWGGRHPLVRAARWYERAAGALGDAHLCVSQAMQTMLAERWRIGAIVLYDRPVERRQPLSPAARAALFDRLHAVAEWPLNGVRPDAANRPALIVSPTSWTADEDFSVLLEALDEWEARLRAEDGPPTLPSLVVLVTGRGPLRAAFEARVHARTWRHVTLHTLWLPPDDYPQLLAAADLGLCVHRSTSGVDLPLKLADMVGAGLPVCAYDYGPCLAEQVRHGENGLTFATGADLARQFCELFRGFPSDTPLLDRLRHNVVSQSARCWSEEWAAKALPVFTLGG